MSQDSKVTSLDAPAASAKGIPVSAVKATAVSSGSGGLSGKLQKIKIFAGTEDGGNQPVFLSHNGTAWKIPRDSVQDVPVELVEILNNAITTITATAPNGIGVITRDVPRYNFQTVA